MQNVQKTLAEQVKLTLKAKTFWILFTCFKSLNSEFCLACQFTAKYYIPFQLIMMFMAFATSSSRDESLWCCNLPCTCEGTLTPFFQPWQYLFQGFMVSHICELYIYAYYIDIYLDIQIYRHRQICELYPREYSFLALPVVLN